MTNNSNLSPENLAALNAHRQGDGQFGAHANTNPEAVLPAQPAAPVTVTLVRQMWDEDTDDLIELGSEEIEVRQILDNMDLDEIIDEDEEDEEAGGHFDHDNIYFAAEKLGLIKPHDGPFRVDLDDSARDYVTARREAGQEEAVSTREPLMALGLVDKKLEGLGRKRAAMNQEEFEAGRTGVAQVILKRFPTATGATIFNSAADDGGVQYEVSTITGPDGSAAWSYDAGTTDYGFREELLEYSIYLDRRGSNVLRDGIAF